MLITPTFAAGLGVVIAAGLAAGVTQNVLRYNGPPDQGTPCAVKGCGVAPKGTLASAKPGKRLVGPVAGRRKKAAGITHARLAAPHSWPDGRGVVVVYRTLRQGGQGGFQGEITIASTSGHGLPAHWTFRFTYPSGQIGPVWAAGSVQQSAHSATVTGQAVNGWPGGQQVQIVFSVAGTPGAPAGCTLDGYACHYLLAPDGGSDSGSGGYGGGSYGGGGYGYRS